MVNQTASPSEAISKIEGESVTSAQDDIPHVDDLIGTALSSSEDEEEDLHAMKSFSDESMFTTFDCV